MNDSNSVVTSFRLTQSDMFKLNFIAMYLTNKGLLEKQDRTELIRFSINDLYIKICNLEGVQPI